VQLAIQSRSVVLIRRDYEIAKRIVDVTICALILPFVLVVLAFCALAVWLEDPGKVVFTQNRTGHGGKRFKVYKLRTMVKNAESLKEKYRHLNELSWPDFKISKDPRVTRVGRFLRRTSLDELPQIFNVLLGNMSLVGPRPSTFEASHCDLWQTERLEVLPGITGLAQISGRNSIDTNEKIKFDIQYLQNRSIGLDLWILIQTARVIVKQEGAY
jgi:lipopolysaccharide/colanic/teichoic acid biosynthesis glycosyltransferase